MASTQVVGDRRAGTAAATAFRVVAGLQLLAVFAQALFAGLFMGGTHAMRTAHATGGMVVLILAIAQLVTALLMRRPNKVVVASAVMLVAVVGQLIAGGSHLLAVHVPLGLLLFGGALWCARLGWRR